MQKLIFWNHFLLIFLIWIKFSIIYIFGLYTKADDIIVNNFQFSNKILVM